MVVILDTHDYISWMKNYLGCFGASFVSGVPIKNEFFSHKHISNNMVAIDVTPMLAEKSDANCELKFYFAHVCTSILPKLF